ncbi:MAG: nitroreductase family protein [Muribaculaceae bacterium]|nr:nitroreductase family protein [Muribaculaceae bacterium]
MSENYFLSRKSCRNFKDEKISEKEIENIVTQASKAPTCGNMQLYSVIVTEDKDKKKALANYHFNQPAAVTAPIILTICADFNRFNRWCKINEADAGYDNFHSFIVSMTDAIIFAQQLMTIAELQGYGTCYLGTVNYNAKEISELLKLPELVIPVASLAIGLPAIKGEETHRLPIKGILHKEFYVELTDSEIKEIFKIHDENPDNKKFLEETGKDNLAQVFAEIRYPKDLNEKVSESFYNLLKEKGF